MTPEFYGDLVLKEFGPYEWLVYHSLQYCTLVRGKPEMIKVPDMFNTDLASIPRLAQWLIPVNGRHRRPAVVHDYLYRNAGQHDWTRAQADKVFLEAMAVTGVPWYRRQLMYAAVRAGGWVPWKNSLERNT